MSIRMPIPPDPELLSQWSRVQTSASKLFESLDKLTELGGVCKVAAANRWSPHDHDKVAGQLLATKDAIEAELAQLELRRRHYPRPWQSG